MTTTFTTTSFTDSAGRSWTLKFDGLLLADLRAASGINLADLSGGDYFRCEQDASALVTALCVLLREPLKAARVTREQLAESLVGECLDHALAALWEAAKLFFPAKRLSELLRNFNQLSEQWRAMGQAMSLLSQPGIPPALVETLTTAILHGLANSVSAASASTPSAGGPEGTPPSAATDSRASAA